MKLKNKLMPLAGLCAVCTAAIPLASCAQGNTSVDLKARYTPEEIRDHKVFESIEKANQDYFNNSNFAKHFAEDYYWSTSEANYVINASQGSEGKPEAKKLSKQLKASRDDKYIVFDGDIRVRLSDAGYIFDLPSDLNLYDANTKITINTEIVKDMETLSDVNVNVMNDVLIDGSKGAIQKIKNVYCVSYKLEYNLKLKSSILLDYQVWDSKDEKFITKQEYVESERTVKGVLEVSNLPMTLAYGIYKGLETTDDIFYLTPDMNTILGRAIYVTSGEEPGAKMIECVAKQHITSQTSAVSNKQGYKVNDEDQDVLVGFRADGSTYMPLDETEAFVTDPLTTANEFASWYLYSCRLGEDE